MSGRIPRICRVASKPLRRGMVTSITMTSGFSSFAFASPSSPSTPSPQTSYPDRSKSERTPFRTTSWSSTINTRMGLPTIYMPVTGVSESGTRAGYRQSNHPKVPHVRGRQCSTQCHMLGTPLNTKKYLECCRTESQFRSGRPGCIRLRSGRLVQPLEGAERATGVAVRSLGSRQQASPCATVSFLRFRWNAESQSRDAKHRPIRTRGCGDCAWLCPRGLGRSVCHCAAALAYALSWRRQSVPYGLGGGRVRGLVLRARTFHRCNFCVPVRRELLAAAFVEVWCLGPSDCHLEYVRVPRFIRDDYRSGRGYAACQGEAGAHRRGPARERSPVAPCPPGPHARGGTEIGTDCGAGPADRSGQRRHFCANSGREDLVLEQKRRKALRLDLRRSRRSATA